MTTSLVLYVTTHIISYELLALNYTRPVQPAADFRTR